MTQQFHSWAYIWKKTKALIWKGTCTPMFTAALFTIAKIWKQPKCPSTDERIKKMCYTYTVEYYSAIKKNEILPFATTLMDLEGILLSEISQTEKDYYYMIILICRIWKVQQTSQYNKKKQTHRYREQTSGYHWGEGQSRGRELRGTNYYI